MGISEAEQWKREADGLREMLAEQRGEGMSDYFLFFMWFLFGVSAATTSTDHSWAQAGEKALAMIVAAFMMAWNVMKILKQP